MPDNIHKARFRPQARILELLGDQLIRHHRIALFELVKNAYDADSPEVFLLFKNILDSNNATIEIRDSGEGMSLDTILNIWFEPASNHQAIKRGKGARSTRFRRLPLGEKGVGRFAVQKLGNNISLITRQKNSPEFCIEIDWRILEKHKYLSEVPVTVTERHPLTFPNDQHGTLIRISDLKQHWTRGEIRQLYRSVTSMVTPFPDKFKEDKFDVKFDLSPDPGWLKGLFSSADADQFALYHFDFLLDDDGFQWEYRFTPFEAMKVEYKNEIVERTVGQNPDPAFEFFSLSPPTPEEPSWKKRKGRSTKVSLKNIGIGSFYGRIVAFDLDPEIKARYINDFSGLSGFLKEQGGMRVYRDGMRVYDYGEPGNDWLGLDVRRVNKPAAALSNNIFVGELLLGLNDSCALIEKTNREGFVENKAYKEFNYAALCALTTFEAERKKDKKVIRDCFKLTKEDRKSRSRGPEEHINKLRQKVLQVGMSNELGPYVDKVEKSYIEARDILMSSVGAGMGLSMVFHEMERGVRGLHQALRANKPVEMIKEMSEHLVKLLQGAAYLVKTNKPESFKASALVNHAVFTHETRFEYHNIQFINGFNGLPEQDFSIRGSRRMLLASLSNLIDNAIHWIKLNRERQEKNDAFIWIGPSHDLEAPAILIADNGAGFMDSPEEVIAPFFTRKSDGMGLGLYYADMALKANKGRLAFPETNDVEIPRKCTGAVIAMVFPEGKK